MAFNLMPASGGGMPRGPCCKSCKQAISSDQRSVRVRFETDPHGFHGLTGDYHEPCSKRYMSMARAINMLSFRKI